MFEVQSDSFSAKGSTELNQYEHDAHKIPTKLFRKAYQNICIPLF